MMMKEEAAATAATTTTTTTTSLVDLPVSALLGIAEYGSIVDCRRLVMTSQRLWTGRHGLERARRRAAVTTAAERAVLASLVSLLPPPPPPPPPLPRLVALELGDAVVDDEFMLAFDWRVDFPALRDISMVGSNRVHGVAVRVALQHHPSLQYVDVTYCPLVEYVDALLLRDSLVVPQAMVRRLPEEMCGMVETNFDNDRFHRYWPDGTFQFDRRQISVGFVKTLRRHTANRDGPQPGPVVVVVTTSSLQFCDLDPRTPHFLRSSWNPAVNLIFLGHNIGHDNNNNDKRHRHNDQQQQQQPPPAAATMLVAQHCRDFLRPPPSDRWPNVTDHAALPLGRSVYSDAHGVRLAQTNAFALPNNNNDDNDNGQVSVATYMVTKMRVLPLECPTTPPDETMAIIRRELNLPMVNNPRADDASSSTTTTTTTAEV